ncbi:MAG: hypothetical protein H0U86_07825 [Chloroflexi bacterium]|nr:hypothetical protein [Chloroflexota bacterium]
MGTRWLPLAGGAVMTRRGWELLAASLSLGAGVAHSMVMPEHQLEWWGYGAFFMVATLAQTSYAIVLFLQPWHAPADRREERGVGTARLVYAAGIVGNLAIIGLYLVTRTIGVPVFGPEARKVEEVTTISVVSKLLELGLIYCLVRAAQLSPATVEDQ